MNADPQAQQFFARFAEDFAAADGPLIAQRYGQPYLALDAQGQTRLFNDTPQIAAYFQQVLDGYFAQGCRTCRFHDLHTQALGARNLFASLTWELLDERGQTRLSWRESYVLSRMPTGLLIQSSADHAD